MVKKAIHYLTVAEAVARLTALKNEVGGNIPVLMEADRTTDRKRTTCVLELTRAATNDVHKEVSRAGQPVVLARRSKAAQPMPTVDDALARFAELVALAGTDDTPFLAYGGTEGYVLCDLCLSKSGASDILRPVSRGGRPVVVVALWAPVKN